jgi:murein DD-endopeptidase MepM/ murein hydrolase activator NlpD
VLPCDGVITSAYGKRDNPLSAGDERHKGIDIAVPMGTEVCAVSDGVVTETGNSDSWGKYMRYKTEDGHIVIFAHLSEVLVSENDNIKKGDEVALSGNSGMSTGPHLHFGVYENGGDIDPMTLIENKVK